MSDKYQISYSQELLRKSIHLISLSIPIVYIYISKELGLKILIPLTLTAILLDILSRNEKSVFHKLFYGIFGKMIRRHEKKTLNGASWVLISAALCFIIFPKIITIVSFSILIISDTSAALIGRRFGKKPFLDKSLLGTTAFIITAFILIFALGFFFHGTWTFYLIGFLSSVIGAIAEAGSKRFKVDDNFSIPLSIGFFMWFGDYLFYSLFGISFLNMMK